MKLKIGVRDIGRRYLVLMTEDGEVLPGQFDITVRDHATDVSTVTVTFHIDGDRVRFEPTSGT